MKIEYAVRHENKYLNNILNTQKILFIMEQLGMMGVLEWIVPQQDIIN